MTDARPVARYDAVELGILWDRLISVADEIVETLVRTSFSTIVREGYDLSVMLFDRNGRLLVQGTRSIPVFIGTAPVTLAHMLERFPPETLAPGDVVVTNDPMMGTGHLFDISVMRPVHRDGALVGYTMSITHLPDIGGMGFSAVATEMFHEGLKIPICKLYEGGRINRLLVDLIRANVRVPEQVMGDILANVSCNEVGARQLLGFMAEYGIDDLVPLSDAIRARSELAMREKIREIPDGTYRNRIDFEGIDGPLSLACTIEKRGDGIAIDFAGSSGTVRGGINVPFCYARAMALYSIKCLTAPTIPNNEGSVAPVAVSAPPGSILNAQPPSPTAGRHIVGHFVTPLIFGALAEAMPDRVQADTGMINIVTFQGRHPDGSAVSTLYFVAGGFGALTGQDGHPTTPGPSNMACVPVEIWESRTGVTVESKRLLADSGGPGEWRGGLGQEIVLRNDTGHPMTIFSMANRTEFAATGFRGGQPGAKREHRINGDVVHPKGRQELEPGDRLALREAGGGGIGDPRRRDRRLVERDVEEGFVSRDVARRIYGLD
ncbi:MAG: hydantoinase B/oxoprolinase family protein [Alphaproteobacteria bacterium]|nr:hydantoinase B/oxoprolinase family protein [Alphaproteobacteria bacterium]